MVTAIFCGLRRAGDAGLYPFAALCGKKILSSPGLGTRR